MLTRHALGRILRALEALKGNEFEYTTRDGTTFGVELVQDLCEVFLSYKGTKFVLDKHGQLSHIELVRGAVEQEYLCGVFKLSNMIENALAGRPIDDHEQGDVD